MAKADRSHLRELYIIEKQNLLIMNDFGLQAFDAGNRSLLMDIVAVIGEQTVADAILDQLVHQSVRIGLKGESLRKNKNENTAGEL